MNPLEINLIRDQVPSRRRRRNIHLAFLGYLVFSGALLVWVAHLCARRMVDADYDRRDWVHDLERLALQYPGDADPDATLARLERESRAAAERLGVAERVLEQRILAARVLLGLRHPLPPEQRLIEVSISRADRSVQFGLAMADDAGPAPARAAADLSRRWAADPLLSAQVHDIKPVRTERTQLATEPVLVERYSATLSAGEKDHGPGPLPP